MLVFMDSEFTQLSDYARLVSIGLISEDGRRHFYAETAGVYERRHCSPFTRDVVLPLLGPRELRMPWPLLSAKLAQWLVEFDEPIEIAIDSLHWDWRWIKAMYNGNAGMPAWPANLGRDPYLLNMNYVQDFDRFKELLELKSFENGLRPHHALDDAKANRLAWLACTGAKS